MLCTDVGGHRAPLPHLLRCGVLGMAGRSRDDLAFPL